MSDVIRIKPHHFVDIITEYGAGREEWEPSAYGHAVHSVAARLVEDRDAMLEMESGADDICAPCIHNKDGLCDDTIDTSFRPEAPSSKREWNLAIDGRWYERLGLKDGDRLTAREFVRRVRDALGGGIADVYREIPPEMTAERRKNLQSGAERYLKGRAPRDQ